MEGRDLLCVGGVVVVEHNIVWVLQHVSLVQLVQVWAVVVLPALMQGAFRVPVSQWMHELAFACLMGKGLCEVSSGQVL